MFKLPFIRTRKARWAKAMAIRAQADSDLQRAVLSGCTQRIHAARAAMRDATHALMRLENAINAKGGV